MYQRKYYQEDAIKIPENYVGYALTEEEHEEKAPPSYEVPPKPQGTHDAAPEDECETTYGENPWQREHPEEATACVPVPAKKRESILDGVFLACERLGLHLPSFDFEDLLLIGIGLSLLLSKERDIECGLVLLALVFL